MEQTIEVATWVELRELPAAMDRFATQFGDITDHAVAWVCRRDGFEPSPACVLRPLAEAMDPLRAGCETVGRWPVCVSCEGPEHSLYIQPDLGGPDPMWVCEESGQAVAPLGHL